jgi:hypothetical protein
MSSRYATGGKRLSSMTHARRSYTCVCGKRCTGNGGWSSHKRACMQRKDAKTARGLATVASSTSNCISDVPAAQADASLKADAAAPDAAVRRPRPR